MRQQKSTLKEAPTHVLCERLAHGNGMSPTLKCHMSGAKQKKSRLVAEVNNYLRIILLSYKFPYSHSWITIMY